MERNGCDLSLLLGQLLACLQEYESRAKRQLKRNCNWKPPIFHFGQLIKNNKLTDLPVSERPAQAAVWMLDEETGWSPTAKRADSFPSNGRRRRAKFLSRTCRGMATIDGQCCIALHGSRTFSKRNPVDAWRLQIIEA